MPDSYDVPALDGLVDAIAARLADRLGNGPLGEPSPQLPPGLDPRVPLSPVPEFFTGSRLRISGVEFTQSTQHHSAAGGGYGPDNSVPLVAYKPMFVRVHPRVETGLFGVDTLTGRRVTGELTLSIGDRVVYRTGPTRSGGARVGRSNQVSRTLWDTEITAYGGGGAGTLEIDPTPLVVNCPLNFLVPAYYCKRGRMHAAVRIWPVDEGPGAHRAVAHSQYLQFLNVQAPKICLVRVNWVDANGTVSSPTDQQMLDTLRLATRMLPFPYFETTILGVEQTKNGAFAMPVTGGKCNPAWDDLLEDLEDVRIWTRLFQLGDIVYGLVPQAAIPAGGGTINAGCGDVTGGGFAGAGFETTFAHELGHLYDAKHVFVTGDDDNEPNYPAYGWKRSIGAVGIDTGTTPPTLYDPDEAIDIMAYATPADPEPQWISPFTYQRILDNRGLHASAPVDPSRVRPVLILGLRIHREVEGHARIDIRRAAMVAAPGPLPPRPEGAVSPLSIDLLDAEGQILATHHTTWARRHAGGDCGCGPTVAPEREPWLDVTEAIEWPEGVSSVAFHRGGRPLHTIDVGEAPEVSIEGPERGEDQLVVHVRARHPRDTVSVVVAFSPDDGLTWQPVAYDPPDGRVTLSTDHLPGGARCRFRVVGTAELNSATTDTEPFELPSRPRRLYLDVPGGDCAMAPGVVYLAAMVDSRGLGAPAPDEVRWASDLQGELGSGYAVAPDLPAGEHAVTVTAPDGLGGTLSERAIIVVGGRPQRPMSG